MPFAHGLGFSQWLVPQFVHVVGGSDVSSAPHAEQKRTGGMAQMLRAEDEDGVCAAEILWRACRRAA